MRMSECKYWNNKHKECSISNNTYEQGYQQGRLDAFHEVIAEMCKSPFAGEKMAMVKKYIQEQMKGEQNE